MFWRPQSMVLVALLASCGGAEVDPDVAVVTLPGSAVGAEAELLRDQLARFSAAHPGIRVVQRRTPDAADRRHQLYVQWLNAGVEDPDVLQLDVIWTPEFAAAGWLLPMEDAERDGDFFPATLRANRWRGVTYARPWFVDFGLLYWRTDLLERAPATFDELEREARDRSGSSDVPYGLIWQGARYEGLVTVFVEYLTAFGASILDAEGRVAVDSPSARRALDAMQSAVVPREVLGWHEEETRFAFQNGRALFMRNWPYAYPLLSDAEHSRVAGRFGVAPMPAATGGRAGAALGGSQLAINARTDQPEAAREVVAFLTAPEQMLERARRLGQYPPRPSLYAGGALRGALAIPPDAALAIIARAVARPATPVYTELSSLLQVHLHRALSGQESSGEALDAAGREMRALLERVGLADG